MRTFSTAILICFLFTACKSPAKEERQTVQPNILFISIDDMNDWSPCLGDHPNVKTPNIDRLARKGMLFKNAHCQAPLCGPSRASIYTGMHPHSTGIYYQLHDPEIKKSSEKAATAIFLPDYFEEYGYKTMGVGKLLHDGDRAGVYDKYGGVFPEMGFGPRPEERLNFNPRWFSKTKNTATDWGAMDLPDSGMSDYRIAEWAVEALSSDHDRPFFLSVGFIRPHVPWHAPEEWFEKFPVEDMVVPPFRADDLDDVPGISRSLHEMPAMPKTEWLIENGQWKPMIQAYLACMAFMDHQLGTVLNALEESKYADNTIVVLWSDHGYHLGEKNRTCKHSLWHRSTHVPLIFAGTGIRPGISSNAQVGLIDIYPTLTELCGLDDNLANEGHSLVPLIMDPGRRWEHPAFTSYGYKNISMYLDGFHFIQYVNGEAELYDMEQDPNEWNNLANNPDYGEIIDRFRKELPDQYEKPSAYSVLNANSYVDGILESIVRDEQ